jgi:predicted ATP-grasp superfamily ATP-dependent carboligase
LSVNGPFTVHGKPEMETSSLIVGWTQDAGARGPSVINYLNAKLGTWEFGEIEPADFFPLGGVEVEGDVAQFPESKFYCSPEKRLVIFRSDPPVSEWHRFSSSILDVAEHYCHATELYTIGAMIYFGAHTTPRQMLGVANSAEMQETLSRYDLAGNFDFETPPGQRPTMSSYLLWTARQRGIAGASLWVPVPYYLASADDAQSWKLIARFLDRRFDLGIGFEDLDDLVMSENVRLGQLRARSPEIDGYITRLESNLALSEEESEKLVREVQESLSEED